MFALCAHISNITGRIVQCVHHHTAGPSPPPQTLSRQNSALIIAIIHGIIQYTCRFEPKPTQTISLCTAPSLRLSATITFYTHSTEIYDITLSLACVVCSAPSAPSGTNRLRHRSSPSALSLSQSSRDSSVSVSHEQKQPYTSQNTRWSGSLIFPIRQLALVTLLLCLFALFSHSLYP